MKKRSILALVMIVALMAQMVVVPHGFAVSKPEVYPLIIT